MSGQPLRIGTRKSVMALAQTEAIARLLRAADPALDVEIVKFETRGDQDQTSKLLRHGGKGGAFVAEIREAMRAGQLQAAMHSLKDVPGNEETPGLIIAATLPRDAANDALVLRPGVSLEEFRTSKGKGFKIGTNAVRRAAYLRRLFPEATDPSFDIPSTATVAAGRLWAVNLRFTTTPEPTTPYWITQLQLRP